MPGGKRLRQTLARPPWSAPATSIPLTVSLEQAYEPFFENLSLSLSLSEQETKVAPDTVDYKAVVSLLNCPLSSFVTPTHSGVLCLWGEEDAYSHVEVEYGQQIRVKTRGNSPLIGQLLFLASFF